jgi:hypothetical protein
VVLKQRAVNRRIMLSGTVALGLGLALGLGFLAPTLSHLGRFAGSNVNLGDATGGLPTGERVLALLEMLSVGDRRLAPVFPLALALGTLVAVGVASARSRVGGASLCVFGTTALLWIAARPLFHARFFAFLLPLAIVLAAHGAAELARRTPWQKKRTYVFLVAAPLAAGWLWATCERSSWETQPVKQALAFARERSTNVAVVGLGSNLVEQAWVTSHWEPVRAVVELFPERADWTGVPGSYELETRDFPGLYSDVRVHLLRARPAPR